MKKKTVIFVFALFVLVSCSVGENNTCPNGTPFMWTPEIHCIGGQEFITP